MGYKKIPNLYKNSTARDILDLDQVYALEKIHGTSAHVSIDKHNEVVIFPGRVKLVNLEQVFIDKFDSLVAFFMKLKEQFDLETADKITIYGEAYGGRRLHKMSHVYGPLNFVAFEVLLEHEGKETWLSVPEAAKVVYACGLEFVHYEKGSASIVWLDAQRDKPSTQAMRNGMGDNHPGEGIVIRPLTEKLDRFGHRIMAKHKTAAMSEVSTPRKVDPDKKRKYEKANEVASEFVNDMRLEHVLDSLRAGGFTIDVKLTGEVVRSVISDVKVEEGDEIAWNPEISKAIGRKASELYRKYLKQRDTSSVTNGGE